MLTIRAKCTIHILPVVKGAATSLEKQDAAPACSRALSEGVVKGTVTSHLEREVVGSNPTRGNPVAQG